MAEKRDGVKCLDSAEGDAWKLYRGDSVRVLPQLPDNSVHLTVTSPPFSSLYIYSDSIADMGNCASDEEFLDHYYYLAKELYRVTAPGRQCVIHCKELVYYQNQRGSAGLRDLPGDIIRVHQAAGWDFHSRRTVWRCPVNEMTKTKAQGLLYKQLRQDSTYSRAGLPEYMLWFRKWPGEGDALDPVQHEREDFPLDQWQRWASCVWIDTRATDVLNVNAAREGKDEKHICPLPLDLIERAVIMGTNKGDVVLDPFNGIGSSGVVALKNRRRYVGIELKASYFSQAARYLKVTENESAYPDLFERMQTDGSDVLYGEMVA